MKTIIIQGSSRANGDTFRICQLLTGALKADHIDLLDYSFSGFDYTHANREDDFLPLMRQLITDYDHFIFATPVYWYSMSGLLKHFFDRISDLLKIEKPLGRQLRGKRMSSVSVSGHDEAFPSVQQPFELSADYLGMDYGGHLHAWVVDQLVPEDAQNRLQTFAHQLIKQAQ